MKEIDYRQSVEATVRQLPAGAFLTTKLGNRINTMTIGWGTIGLVWRKPIFQVLVRGSRYTHATLDATGVFTVSVPAAGTMKEALALCGSKSGKALDKLAACGLKTLPGTAGDVPILEIPGTHYECRVVYRRDMVPEELDPEIAAKFYADSDYHTLYFGEILACYEL